MWKNNKILKKFNNLKIRSKIFLSYLSVLLVVVLFFGIALHIFIHNLIQDNIQAELENSVDTVVSMVRKTAKLSVVNYLRGISEQNRMVAKHFYNQQTAGVLTQAQAKAMAGEMMLSGTIGKTGYAFVWDISKTPNYIPLAVHPEIQGKDVSGVAFVQDGAKLKNGYLEYEWANPSDKGKRKKSMYISEFKPWDWLIVSSSYRDEFYELVEIDDFKDYISSIKFGKTGYIYIINSKGDMLLHPQIARQNVYNVTDAYGWKFIQNVCKDKNGEITYTWKNPDENQYHEKLAMFRYIPEYDWIVIASGYPEEIFAPLKTARTIMIVFSVIVFGLALGVSYWLSSRVSRPILKLTDVISKMGSGQLDSKIDIESNDEIGFLAETFNQMLENLKTNMTSIENLNNEIKERKHAQQNVVELNCDLEQTVAKLEEANEELRHFTYIASHDLREPLRKITGFGLILQTSLQDKLSDDDTENLSFMIEGAERMTKMINGLLAYSRAGTIQLDAKDVDFGKIVEEIEELELSVLIEEKNVKIEIPQPLPHVNADELQMKQLMQNLMANAIKYQPAGSQPIIRITSAPEPDGMVKIMITDNGIGIKPEQHQAVFGMFKRLHARGSEYEGTGIGLAVCKKFVERNGGKIGVESQLGQGSTFWFTAKYIPYPASKITTV